MPRSEARYRPRGVLAQRGPARVPIPGPQRAAQPNGAPPPAPTALEGTPGVSGPRRTEGLAMLYTPPADGLPSPGNPLPCAGLDQGPVRSAPAGSARPRGERAGQPGRGRRTRRPQCRLPRRDVARDDRGARTAAGARSARWRTVPVGPLPGPATDIPGIAPLPPAFVGPIPPAGPGPQVPPVGALAPSMCREADRCRMS